MSQNILTTLEEKELREVLYQSGLKSKEQDVYLALLSVGATTMTPLGRFLHMPPTTVQSITLRLHEMGVVHVSKRHSRHVYEAVPPEAFVKILEERARQMKGVLPFLEKFQTPGGDTQAKLRVYYRERMADIFHDALGSKNKLIYEIVSARELQDILGEKFHLNRRRIAAGVRLKSLRVEANEIKKYSKEKHVRGLREALFLPRQLTFKANIMFWDNTVAFFSTNSEGIAWTVTSVSIREMMSQLFGLLWSVSRKMENG